ncbi:MAG: hypothetical protein JWQ09_657 [Segetibacter sp.]|nr:hypothetical protein [Segetibacter sp.]
MKKLYPLFYVLVCSVVISCRHNDNNISITYSNSDHYYSMKANFSKNKTRDVEEYMDRRLARMGNMSFVNTRIDGTIALDDHTIFYIKKSPGVLRIKMDKDENSEEAYYRVKSMCEGIKSIVKNN